MKATSVPNRRVALIERYRDRLPLGADDPVVTLMEGSTPLIPAPRLSERLGIETHLKFEGMNPTGSFKDRGMTVAVSWAAGRGRRGGDLRLHRQHGRECRRLRGAGGHALRGDRAGGKDRPRQARAGRHARCPRDRPAGQLRPGARDRARRSSRAIRSSWSTRSTRTGSRARRPLRSRSATSSGAAPDALCDPGRQRGERDRLVAGVLRVRARAGRACTGFRPQGPRRWCSGRPVGEPRDGRVGDQDREPRAVEGGRGGVRRSRAAGSRP